MTSLRDRCVLAAFIGLSLVVACGELNAQTSTAAAASTAASTAAMSGTGAFTGSGMGMGGLGMGGMGLMPMMSAMNPSASPSPTDAAALGMQSPSTGLGMNPMNGVFMNPMAAPYLLGYPMSTNQIGAMMMMNQMGATTGLGSGQLSGVRPGVNQGRSRVKQPPAKTKGTTTTPGGLASRYFNRTVSVNRPANVNRIPQNYYTRQNRYYPQVAR
jgi:hypothetical protein